MARKEFSWRILWPETGEIMVKSKYNYPHTAFSGARAFVRGCLKYGDRYDLEPLRVEVIPSSEDLQTRLGSGTVMKYFEGTVKEFLRRK